MLCGLVALGANPSALRAQVVLEECSQQELVDKIEEARSAGDGTVLINCDGVIALTNTIHLGFDETNDANEITLDASGFGVTISGQASTNAGDGVRLFFVDSGVTLNLINVRLIDGRSTNGGAVYISTNATFSAMSCVFSNNLAVGGDGIDGAGSPTNASTTSVRGKAGGHATTAVSAGGGAVYNLGTARFVECAFLTNSVVGGNGGIGGNGSTAITVGGAGGNGGRGGSALGGAIYNGGWIEITNTSFYLNLAFGGVGGAGGAGGAATITGAAGKGGSGGGASGGAVFGDRYSLATIRNSTFALNVAAGGDSPAAGGRASRGRTGLAGPAGSGGALANFGTNLLINCTFFGNTVVAGTGGDGGEGLSLGGKGGSGGVAWGGNVFNGGKGKKRGDKKPLLQAINCTFSDGGATGGTNGLGGDAPVAGKTGARGASRGGNIANSNGVFVLQNSLVAYPNPGTNVYGKLIDFGHNILSDRSYKFPRKATVSSTNLLAGASTNGLKLGVLARNGGLVETVELMEGSPAINRAINTITLTNDLAEILELEESFDLDFDARGVARPYGDPAGMNDVGAYESGVVLGPPRIVTQPVDRKARLDGTVTFTVVAQGDEPLIYQWRRGDDSEIDSERITGVTSSTLTIALIEEDDAGDYEVVVFNNSGSAVSDTVTLTLVTAPVIEEDLEDAEINQGDQLILRITATGDEPLRYQWYTNAFGADTAILVPGAELSTYIIANAQKRHELEYTVVVRNDYGFATSTTARVTVSLTNSPPTIVSQPVSTNLFSGDNAVFTVDADGFAPLRYQWYFNNSILLTGATNATLTINAVQTNNAGLYHAVISNNNGTTNSAAAALTVLNAAPLITTTTNFVDRNVDLGGTATFGVNVTGSKPLSIQWYQLVVDSNFTITNTIAVPGGTNATLTITNVQASHEGLYRVTATNSFGSDTSERITDLILNVIGFGNILP